MSDTERSLLDAVLENPDDDLPRLVFADFLEDQGQLTRADFIRTQIALCEEVEGKRYDSDAYAAANKKMLKFDFDELIYQMGIATRINQAEDFTLNLFDEVMRLRQISTNLEYHIERGFPFSITLLFSTFTNAQSNFFHFPIRKFRFFYTLNRDTNSFIELQNFRKDDVWTSRIVNGRDILHESNWPSRHDCLKNQKHWFLQFAKSLAN